MMMSDELKAIEARVADGFTHVGDNRILLARITELEAENERILGSHDAYAAEAEDAIADRKDAEAALERALADGAAIRETLDFIKDLEVEVVFRGHGEDYAKMAFPLRHWQNLCKAHAADHPGDKLPAGLREKVLAACYLPADAPESGWPQEAVDAAACIKEQICVVLDETEAEDD